MSMDGSIDATEIGPRLFQGSEPPHGLALKKAGFNVLVLAAQENQPPASVFPGVRVIYCPTDDCSIVPVEQAHKAAREVASLWKRGARILVTCHMGWNRSGIINALAWRYITGGSGPEAVHAVRSARGQDALSNRHFRAYIESLSALASRASRSAPVSASAMGGLTVEHAGKSEESLTGPALVLGALLFFGAFAARR